MKFDLALALADKPGQLLKALEPIAKNGGNIISIIHERDRPVEGYVPVSLVVDFPSLQNFRSTISDLKNLGVAIIKSEEVIERVRLTFILIGGIDLKRIIESKIENLRIIGFEASSPKPNEVCVKLDIEAPVDMVDKIIDEFKMLSKEEDTVFISPI